MMIYFGVTHVLELLRQVRVRRDERSVVEIARRVPRRLFALWFGLVLDRFMAVVGRLLDRLILVGLVGKVGHQALRFAGQLRAHPKGAVG